MTKIDKKAKWDEQTIKDGKLCVGGFEVLKAWKNPWMQSKDGKGWKWFGTKIESKQKGQPFIWYGYVIGFENEWGTWYQSDMISSGITEIPKEELKLGL